MKPLNSSEASYNKAKTIKTKTACLDDTDQVWIPTQYPYPIPRQQEGVLGYLQDLYDKASKKISIVLR